MSLEEDLNLILNLLAVDRDHHLDARIEIALHPVRRTEEIQGLASVVELDDAGVLKVSVYQGFSPKVFLILVQCKRADSPDHQGYGDPICFSFHQMLDHLLVYQVVELQNDRGLFSCPGLFHLSFDQRDEALARMERRDYQMLEFHIGKPSLKQQEQLIYLSSQFGICSEQNMVAVLTCSILIEIAGPNEGYAFLLFPLTRVMRASLLCTFMPSTPLMRLIWRSRVSVSVHIMLISSSKRA